MAAPLATTVAKSHTAGCFTIAAARDACGGSVRCNIDGVAEKPRVVVAEKSQAVALGAAWLPEASAIGRI